MHKSQADSVVMLLVLDGEVGPLDDWALLLRVIALLESFPCDKIKGRGVGANNWFRRELKSEEGWWLMRE